MSGTQGQSFDGYYNLANLTAPASGTTHAAKFILTSTGAGTIVVNMSGYMEFLGDFQGQACTVDNSANTTPLTVSELTFGWSRVVPAGTVQSFQYPAVKSQVFNFAAASASTIGFNVFDWPLFPDWGSVNPATGGSTVVTIADQPIEVTQTAATSTPTEGASTAIVAGGTPVTVFPAGSIVNTGVITNPNGASEILFVDPVNPAGTAEGGSTFGLEPGQSFTFPPSTVDVTANAITTGHTFTAVVF